MYPVILLVVFCSNGWEKNGLFEFFKAKLKYLKEKPRNIAAIVRSPSPPPLPVNPDEMGKDRSRSRSPKRR